MKKVLYILLAACMMMLLCACGLEKQTVELNYGEEQKIELKKEYDGIKWVSSDAKVATVSNSTVKATAPGEAVLTAEKDGKAVAEITVSVKLVDITAILFSQKNIELEVEESVQQQYTLLPDNASDYGLSWKSANTEVAEVDVNGSIRGVAPGTTTIVCSTPNGILDTCEVVVKAPSAIEQLNEEEKIVFEKFMANVQAFYNAPAARIKELIAVKVKNTAADKVYTSEDVFVTNIQGTNRMGGTLFKYYMGLSSFEVPNQDFMSKPIDGVEYIEIPSEFLDVGKINAAIEEYWNGRTH